MISWYHRTRILNKQRMLVDKKNQVSKEIWVAWWKIQRKQIAMACHWTKITKIHLIWQNRWIINARCHKNTVNRSDLTFFSSGLNFIRKVVSMPGATLCPTSGGLIILKYGEFVSVTFTNLATLKHELINYKICIIYTPAVHHSSHGRT